MNTRTFQHLHMEWWRKSEGYAACRTGWSGLQPGFLPCRQDIMSCGSGRQCHHREKAVSFFTNPCPGEQDGPIWPRNMFTPAAGLAIPTDRQLIPWSAVGKQGLFPSPGIDSPALSVAAPRNFAAAVPWA